MQKTVHMEPETKKKRIIKCIKKYFDSSSLHGLKYLSEPDRPIYERCYWMAAIIAVYVTVAMVILEHVQSFLQSPVLITLDSKSRSVGDIPFPAVTICPDNQIRPSLINLTEAFNNVNNLTNEKKNIFEFAIYICKFNHSFTMEAKNSFNSRFIRKMLNSVYGFEACQKQMRRMGWGYTVFEEPCRFLQPMIAAEGGCLSFNMLPLNKIFRISPKKLIDDWIHSQWKVDETMWSPDTGYLEGHNGSVEDPPPWRTVGNNMGNSVWFDLSLALDDYEGLCSRGGKGFHVYIHNPAEMPSAPHSTLYIDENRDTTVTVQPKYYITDESLHQWSTVARSCYFQTERSLRFFQIYTQHNCELECEANHTESICQCVSFYHPRNNESLVCGPKKRECITQALGEVSDNYGGRLSVCNCLPSCSELQYEIMITSAKRNWSLDLDHDSNGSYTLLRVKFQGKFFIGIKRTVMFGFTDFVANIGGLLGLFLGFSILSLIELIYFIFFRPCTDTMRKIRAMKKLNSMEITGYSTKVAPHPVHSYPPSIYM